MRPEAFSSPLWSGEEYDFLIKHWRTEGWTPARIAAEKPGPARTVNACNQKAHYLGLTDRSIPPNLKYGHMYPRLYLLAAQDHTLSEIRDALEREFGISASKPWVLKTLRRKPQAYQRWLNRRDARSTKGEALMEAMDGLLLRLDVS